MRALTPARPTASRAGAVTPITGRAATAPGLPYRHTIISTTKTLKVGDTFYEPTGCLHRVSRNPSKKGKTRVLAVVLHPRDTRQITIPDPKK